MNKFTVIYKVGHEKRIDVMVADYSAQVAHKLTHKHPKAKIIFIKQWGSN